MVLRGERSRKAPDPPDIYPWYVELFADMGEHLSRDTIQGVERSASHPYKPKVDGRGEAMRRTPPGLNGLAFLRREAEEIFDLECRELERKFA